MEGIIRKINSVERNKKSGEKFKQIVFTVDVITNEEKGTIKTRSAYFNEQYIKDYASYCKLSSSEMIGKTVNVILEKKMYEKDGVKKISETIKFLNFLDENGNAIIMKKDDTQNDIGF